MQQVSASDVRDPRGATCSASAASHASPICRASRNRPARLPAGSICAASKVLWPWARSASWIVETVRRIRRSNSSLCRQPYRQKSSRTREDSQNGQFRSICYQNWRNHAMRANESRRGLMPSFANSEPLTAPLSRWIDKTQHSPKTLRVRRMVQSSGTDRRPECGRSFSGAQSELQASDRCATQTMSVPPAQRHSLRDSQNEKTQGRSPWA